MAAIDSIDALSWTTASASNIVVVGVDDNVQSPWHNRENSIILTTTVRKLHE